ncbi:hypothetical protein [Polyangium jinanense]|uniref:Uncharacterized protein n=1 Tax=Polyangium jinanense TaxID=2829994 RepID=A0A9X3XCX9_9BACT|nr:hypothetical protein [Polyangium jinanense]MDC3986970.1 hypothetical protein [Polyangium jinanense]
MKMLVEAPGRLDVKQPQQRGIELDRSRHSGQPSSPGLDWPFMNAVNDDAGRLLAVKLSIHCL